MIYHGPIFWLHDQLLNTQPAVGNCQVGVTLCSRWDLSYNVYKVKANKDGTLLCIIWWDLNKRKSCPPGVNRVLILPPLLHFYKEALEWNRWLLWWHYTAVVWKEFLLFNTGENISEWLAINAISAPPFSAFKLIAGEYIYIVNRVACGKLRHTQLCNIYTDFCQS